MGRANRWKLCFVSLTALTLTLAGSCAKTSDSVSRTAYQQLRAMCIPERNILAEPLHPDDPADSAIATRFGEVCQPLRRLDGLKFDVGQRAYTCGLALPYRGAPGADAKTEKFERAFGKRWHAGSFDVEASEPDPLRPSPRAARRSVPGADFVTQEPINGRSSFQYSAVTFVLLADAGGKFEQLLATRVDFGLVFDGVSDLNGAIALLSLRENVGKQVCTADSVTENSDGWEFSGVRFLPNCGDERIRDFHVTRSGETKVLSDRPPLFGGAYYCVD